VDSPNLPHHVEATSAQVPNIFTHLKPPAKFAQGFWVQSIVHPYFNIQSIVHPYFTYIPLIPAIFHNFIINGATIPYFRPYFLGIFPEI